MSAGYVYILINPSMVNLIKIGCTFRDSRARARELSTTGVPTPFQVAFEVFSESHKILEEKIHSELKDFRVSDNREFFRYPLDKAIQLIQKFNIPPEDSISQYAAEDILSRLRKKYPKYLRSEIVSIRIIQTQERVWLEITEEEEKAGYLRDQTIKRTDLAFICDGNYESCLFKASDNVTINANKFVDEFDPFSIIMTTDLFHDEACVEVNEKFNPHK